MPERRTARRMRFHARCIGLVAAYAALAQAAAFSQHRDVARRGLLDGLLGLLGGGDKDGDENQNQDGNGGDRDQGGNNNGNGGGNAAETVTTTLRQTITVGAAVGGQFNNASTVTTTVTMAQQAEPGDADAAQKCVSRPPCCSLKRGLTDN